jgi:hypothetical protein
MLGRYEYHSYVPHYGGLLWVPLQHCTVLHVCCLHCVCLHKKRTIPLDPRHCRKNGGKERGDPENRTTVCQFFLPLGLAVSGHFRCFIRKLLFEKVLQAHQL